MPSWRTSRLTRDRQYGDGKLGERPYTVVDTGGIGESEEGIDRPMTDQARQAVGEADAVLFLVDGRAGLTAADEQVAMELRKLPKPVFLVVNKTDGLDRKPPWRTSTLWASPTCSRSPPPTAVACAPWSTPCWTPSRTPRTKKPFPGSGHRARGRAGPAQRGQVHAHQPHPR